MVWILLFLLAVGLTVWGWRYVAAFTCWLLDVILDVLGDR